MNPTILIILPIILMFLAGILLKKIKILKKDDGDILLKLIYYIGAPSLFINSLTTIKLTRELAIFPLAAAFLIVFSFILVSFAVKFLKLKKTTRGVLMISSMIINTWFVLPFIIVSFGADGVARFVLFDFVGTTLVFTWIYSIACRHNPAGGDHKTILKKLITSPPVWAILIGIIINLTGLILPEFIYSFTKSIGSMVAPIMMIALGLYFEPKIINLPATFTAIGIRIILGLLIGILIVSFFNIHGINRQIIILLSASPIGFNTITFAALENLDKEFAASIVSIGLLIGIILTPILMLMIGV